jgi:hypothetical protein
MQGPLTLPNTNYAYIIYCSGPTLFRTVLYVCTYETLRFYAVWNFLAQDRGQVRALVGTVMNSRFHKMWTFS